MTLNVEMTDIRAEFEDTVYMYGSLSLIHISWSARQRLPCRFLWRI